MTRPARVPADVYRPDRVVGPFTARQAAILAGTAAALYLLWILTHQVVAPVVFLAVAVPAGVLAVAIALGQRDGLSLDRLLVAAIRHRLNPPAPNRPQPLPQGPPDGTDVPEWISARTTTDDEAAPPASGRRPSGFPAHAVTSAAGPAPGGPALGGPARGGVGVVDLGGDGLVVVAVVSTVNFGLRTPAEQDGLVAGFARYLHGLGGPVQILIRALPVNLDGHLQQLHAQIGHLPHPALAAAAHDHLHHLTRLAHGDGDDQLLARQVLLVLREPHHSADRHPAGHDPAGRGPAGRDHAGHGHAGNGRAGRDQPGRGRVGGGAGERRLLRRLHDATMLLAPLDLTVTVLTAAQTTALLVHTCSPDQPNPDHPSPPHEPRHGRRGHDADSHRIVRAAAPAIGDGNLGPHNENQHGPDGYPDDTEPDEGTDPFDDSALGDAADRDYASARSDASDRDDADEEDWGAERAGGERWGPQQWAVDTPSRWVAPPVGQPTRRPTRRPHPGGAAPWGSR